MYKRSVLFRSESIFKLNYFIYINNKNRIILSKIVATEIDLLWFVNKIFVKNIYVSFINNLVCGKL